MFARAVVLLALFAATACGPTPQGDGDGDGGGTGGGDGGPQPPPPAGNVTGTVWAPGNAIGAVPAGYEIPVANAMVYFADNGAPAELPDEVYCDRCELHPAIFSTTDAKGRFTIENVAAGSHRLVIEKAQFRLVTMIDVPAQQGLAVPAAQTTLPSEHAPAQGKWTPRVAIAIGDSDHIEDIFGKIGMLDVDSEGRVVEASFGATDRIELYGNPIDPPFPSQHEGTITTLFGDLNRMKRYHIIFVPCNFDSNVAPLASPAMRRNIQDYVAAGGKLYVTDWSAEWEDAAFPDFIRFDAQHDTTAAMVSAGSINPGDGDFGHFAMHARATDPVLAEWLDGQKAPLVIPAGGEELDFPSTYADGVIDAQDFVVEGNWTLIRETPAVRIGTDMNGMPVMNTAKTWISGDYMGTYYPHTVTFEPSCGRVMYSTYHTAQKTHEGLVPQERVLLHLIMEIGVCNAGPDID
jgi:hypothetical protein